MQVKNMSVSYADVSIGLHRQVKYSNICIPVQISQTWQMMTKLSSWKRTATALYVQVLPRPIQTSHHATERNFTVKIAPHQPTQPTGLATAGRKTKTLLNTVKIKEEAEVVEEGEEEEVVVDQGTKGAEEEAEVLLISSNLQVQEDIMVNLV